MNKMYAIENQYSKIRRRKRMTFEERKDKCKKLKYGTHVTDMVNSVADDVKKIPLIGTVASIFASGISIIGHITKAGLDIASTALDCNSLPFDEIKSVMKERFNEIDRKLEDNAEALAEISALVSKTFASVERTRREMKQGFKHILQAMENNEIKKIVVKINNFVQYFENERERIKGLPPDEYVFKLQEPNSILDYLRESRTPRGDSLQSALYEIIDEENEYAIPKNEDDVKALQALYALFYGTQAYVSIMFFLMEQHSYLADYYYKKGNIEEFNTQLDLIRTVFDDFKFSLISSFNKKALMNEVIDILAEVKIKDFMKKSSNNFHGKVSGGLLKLVNLKIKVKDMELPFINDTPQPVVQISLIPPLIETPFGDWEDRSKVRYAVQLTNGGLYSKFSEWSEPYTVQGKASPTLTIPVDHKRRTRLIFRKIDDEKPQLVGVLSESQTEFKDINRDLYNAAGRIDEDLALDEVNKLLELGADPNAVFEFGRGFLHAAAKNGNEKVAMEFLLSKNVTDLNVKDKKGYTPLHFAAESGYSGFIKFLLDHGADGNKKIDSGLLTPLHIAAKNGFVKAVQTLIDSNSTNLNESDESGFTALHHATLGGSEIVRTLIDSKRINVNAKSLTGLTPLHLSVVNGDLNVANSLLHSKEVNINENDYKKMTALHFASMVGDVDMIKFLTSMDGIDINASAAKNNWTSLHTAIYFQNEWAALELLKLKAINLSLLADGNITALHMSVANGQLNVAAELLNRESDIEAKTSDGYSPLHLAAMHTDPKVSTMLLKKGANMESKSSEGLTPLHVAISSDRFQTFLVLIEEGANLNAKTPEGSTPLHLATDLGKQNVIVALLNKGADAKSVDKKGRKPIHIAIIKYDLPVVKEFVKHDPKNVDPDSDAYEENINLTYEILMNDIYDYLSNKYSEEYQDFEDMSPYEILEQQGKIDLLRLLVNDPSQEKVIEHTFSLYFKLVQDCVKNEEIHSKKPKSKSRSSCVPPIRYRRHYNALSSYFDKIKIVDFKYRNSVNVDDFSKPGKTYDWMGDFSFYLNRVFNGLENFALGTPKEIENENYFIKPEANLYLNANTANNLILILDLFIRKLTKEKYHFRNKESFDLDIQAMALKIAEQFEKFMDTQNINKQQIDFSDIHRTVYKILKTGNASEIPNFLCSFINSYANKISNFENMFSILHC
ncbi:delta-latroinsectotoxin-Lt1a [Parasteatoda tepidariorum]|uniref:delta-latroinsectotoxin-Lt1a n=1 Tax=Parasteatoda tepidariorum TaxID=114398 RepID=UPI001C72036C|nr:delta-latroinsectotoxin-Lt1a [Parasteatoda tepidariorum]